MARAIRPLTPDEASRTIAHRLGRVADRVRQVATQLGARPIRVFLVWTLAGGEARGEGEEAELARVEILPTPAVSDLSALALNPFSAGRYPIGTVRVTEVSVVSFTRDLLRGERMPRPPRRPVEGERVDFFYELVDDGRGLADGRPARHRCRLAAEPELKADEAMWSLLLERSAEDRDRDGSFRQGADRDQDDD